MRVPRSTSLPLFASPSRVCGVDEAGRGPLAGPVYAAAVILDPARPIRGLRDSKQIPAATRERLAAHIRERALAYAIAYATVEEIDRINILQASLLAMRRAVEALALTPDHVLVDGNRLPVLAVTCEAIIRGDAKIASISAASILAKTARDALMIALHDSYPQYGFDHHMGYPTPHHLDCLNRHGASPIHRKTFAPVRTVLARDAFSAWD